MRNYNDEKTRKITNLNEKRGNNNNNNNNNNRGGARETERNNSHNNSHNNNNNNNNRRHHDQDNERSEKVFGLIISVKETFGFILPYLGDEHIFFSFRDGPQHPEVGEEVEYYIRQTQKGPAAVNVRRIDVNRIKLAVPNTTTTPTNNNNNNTNNTKTNDLSKGTQQRFIGLISWEADPYKNTPGVITLSTPQSNISSTISFLHNDFPKSMNSRRITKGDEVEFDLYIIPGTQYARAKDIVLFRSKRDRQIAEQIQRFAEAGVLLEHGVLDSIKSDYGFIKSCDRPDQLFFKLDDFIDESVRPKENDEVAFYVIPEVSRGKMSDRAVHISLLPPGTVFFEKVISQNVYAYVSSEPKQFNSRPEEPGMLRLVTPIEYSLDSLINNNNNNNNNSNTTNNNNNNVKVVTHVELWSRCLPDQLTTSMRIGDLVKISVVLYRPEKIIFARNVVIEKFRTLGRLYGTIIDVKDSRGYGFIKCHFGGADTYFKTNEILKSLSPSPSTTTTRSDQQFMDEKNVRVSQSVSYECIIEEVSGGESKLRAIRVAAESIPYDRKILFIENVSGVIVREPKKDVQGYINIIEGQINPDNGKPITLPPRPEELKYAYEDIFNGIQEFDKNSDLKELMLEYVLPRQRFAIHELIRSYFNGIAHQTITDPKVASASISSNNNNNNNNIGKGQKIKLWKIEDPVEFAKWNEEELTRNGFGKSNEEKKQDLDDDIDGDNNNNDNNNLKDSNNNNINEAENDILQTKLTQSSSDRIFFNKNDLFDLNDQVSLIIGGVRSGAIVKFDIYIDRFNCNKVASKVRVSDELVTNSQPQEIGVIEFIKGVDGNNTSSTSSSIVSGYIRHLTTDEKLPWISQVKEPFTIGAEVVFEIRNRGGIRYANEVTLFDKNKSNSREFVDCFRDIHLTGKCLGVIVPVLEPSPLNVDNSKSNSYCIFPLDLSSCPEIEKRYHDLSSAIIKSNGKSGNKLNRSDKSTWEKVNQDEIEDRKNDSNRLQQSQDLKNNSSPNILINKIDGIPVYYPPISPSTISFNIESIKNFSCFTGKLVHFKPIVNWSKSRGIIGAYDLEPINEESSNSSDESVTLQSPGTIIRLTINAGNGIELSEIIHRNGKVYYCESKELKVSKNPSDSSIRVGDEVDFYPFDYFVFRNDESGELKKYSIGFCYNPTLRTNSTGPSSILFKKKQQPQSSTLSTTNSIPEASKSVFKSPITMAQGPPNDSDTGFPVGWRGQEFKEKLHTIPWISTLLSHLNENGVC